VGEMVGRELAEFSVVGESGFLEWGCLRKGCLELSFESGFPVTYSI